MPEIDLRVKTIFGNAFLGSKSVRFAVAGDDDAATETVDRRRDDDARNVFRRFDILAVLFN